MIDNKVQLFTSTDGVISLEVSLDKETVWLSQAQLCELFQRDQSVISRHVRNLFAEEELGTESNMQKLHIAGSDKPVAYYSLDVIISVGYRVKSQRGVQFRHWATRVLKQHLVQGYSLNQKRLAERGIEFEQVIALLSKTLSNQQLVAPAGEAVLSVISEYARSWSLLQGYDEQSLADVAQPQQGMFALDFANALDAIAELKRELIAKGEAMKLFVQELMIRLVEHFILLK
jgi:hypothetical protein